MKILERRLGSGWPLGSTCMLEHCSILPRNSSGCTLAGQVCIPSSTSDQQSPELHLCHGSHCWKVGLFPVQPSLSPGLTFGGLSGEVENSQTLSAACIVPWHTLGLGFVLVSSSQWIQIRGRGDKIKQGGCSKSCRFLPVQLGVMIFLM